MGKDHIYLISIGNREWRIAYREGRPHLKASREASEAAKVCSRLAVTMQ